MVMEKERVLIQVNSDHKSTAILVVIFLFLSMLMLMWLTVSVGAMRDTFKETKTEVRILQMQVQDQNAILIRAGITEPGDYTTGPTDPDKLRVKKYERNSLQDNNL